MQKAPVWDSRKRLLSVPASCEEWDVLLANREPVVLRVRPGVYECRFEAPKRARPAGTTSWKPLRKRRLLFRRPNGLLEAPEPPGETACVGLIYPDSQFMVGEELTLQFLPAAEGCFELRITGPGPNDQRFHIAENRWTCRQGLPPGEHTVRVRWVPPLGKQPARRWSDWSMPVRVTYNRPGQEQEVGDLRIREHRLAMMYDRDVEGVTTVTDPWQLPPSCPEDEPVLWFPTPCYEGSTMLLNEEPDFYRDPLAYFLDCVQRLRSAGTRFLTWHELLDDTTARAQREVILQFDLDAGVMSTQRLCAQIRSLGLTGNVMVHRRCHDWYSYEIDQLGLDYLTEAQEAGWCVGYHNNSIGNVQRLSRMGDYGPDVLAEAEALFADDVEHLRQWFNIRTFTHHGGIVFNKLTPVPPEPGVVCVDKKFNRALWSDVRSTFSDGGFMARPTTLRRHVDKLKPGRHFLRIHPVKYANYALPFDVPPLEMRYALRAGAADEPALREQIKQGLEKQKLWLELRDRHRLARRPSYAGIGKPISQRCRPLSDVRALAEKFRARRRETFIRQYPWIGGDPRVFWYRMLDAHCPKSGEILNIGALLPDQRDETIAFLGDLARVAEMDIDPERKPHYLCDVIDAPAELNGRFAAVLLFGLPYFHSPSKAMQACRRLVSAEGVALLGFAADTHPFRGGMWKPKSRPVWRRELEPLENIGLKGQLWSFDRDGLADLLGCWDDVEVEFFSHYWFVVCRKRP